MSRRLGERHPRRVRRMPPVLPRAEHGVAPVALRPAQGRPGDQTPPGDLRLLRALAEENALLARELGRVQARFTRWREDCIGQADRLQAQLMCARADVIVKETRLAALRERLDAMEAPPAPTRLVLCVGGRARQIPVYRALVERRGGRMTHVDAVDNDCLAQLQRSLADANLVILQPGFACQGACRVVEAYCARHGVRCIQLDRSCALAFEQQLERALAAV